MAVLAATWWVTYMEKIGKYSEYDNVIDFTEIYVHQLIEDYAEKNKLESAAKLSELLDRYLMGLGIFEFIEGRLYYRDILTEKDEVDIEDT